MKASVKDRKILAVLMVAFVLTNSHVTTVHAQERDTAIQPTTSSVATDATDPAPTTATAASAVAANTLPAAQDVQAAQPEREPAIRTVYTTMTAYTSAPNQTDATPFVTADGTCVSDGIVAANFLKIGTRVRFPDLFGDKVFEVHDRMNERYSNRIDVWMKDLGDAKQFGLKRSVRVEVIEDGNNKKSWDLGLTNAVCQQIAFAN